LPVGDALVPGFTMGKDVCATSRAGQRCNAAGADPAANCPTPLRVGEAAHNRCTAHVVAAKSTVAFATWTAVDASNVRGKQEGQGCSFIYPQCKLTPVKAGYTRPSDRAAWAAAYRGSRDVEYNKVHVYMLSARALMQSSAFWFDHSVAGLCSALRVPVAHPATDHADNIQLSLISAAAES
jgi:hypothetical protein